MACKSCAALRATIVKLQADVARLSARRVGRSPFVGTDERSRLIASACEKQHLTRTELAKKLGVPKARLSPSGYFSVADNDKLMAELRLLAEDPAED